MNADTQVDQAPDELSWSFNPWQANWRRPLLALVICLAIAVLGGWAFTVPPKHQPSPTVVATAADENTISGEAESEIGKPDELQRPGQAWKDARAQVPWQVHWFWWSLASLLLLTGMTLPVYFSTHYQLNPEGITVVFLGKRSFRSWPQYRNFYPHPNGVHVTTLSTPSRLDPFRGHMLQFSAPDPEGQTNRRAVLAYLGRHMKLKGIPESKTPR